MGPSGSRPGGPVELNVTPLVDVMLVLLVVFMLSAPLSTTDISVSLPRVGQVESVPTADPPPQVVVELDTQGRVSVDGAAIDGPLEQALERALAASPGAQLRVLADGDVPYQAVADVLSRAQRAGFVGIGLGVEPRGSSPRSK